MKPDLTGFELIYDGGHHNVYCNGVTHVWTSGGYAGKWPIEEWKRRECRCGRSHPTSEAAWPRI